MEKQRAFTLIELLVVIAIIGLLTSVVVVSLGGARAKARDARRLSDMNQLIKALEVYYSIVGQYPGPTFSYGESEGTCGGWDTSTVDNDSDGRPFIEPLIDEKVTSIVPTDPTGGGICGGFHYSYFRYGAGDYACDASRGNYYVLGVSDMESTGNPHPDSPGWSCSGRNWQGEFEWVTGRFEK